MIVYLGGLVRPQAYQWLGMVLAPLGIRTVIPGAVHSFFGRYGPQCGDGIPTVAREIAETQIVAALRIFLAVP